MRHVTIDMHGVRLRLVSAYAELPNYVARHFADLVVDDTAPAHIQVRVHWSEGDARPRELLDGSETQLGKRLYARDGVLVWTDTARVRGLSLGVELRDERLRIEAAYHYAPRPDKATLPDYRYKKLFILASWLVLLPLTWYLERFRSLHLLHASGIASDAGGILIAGLGGVGKTTTSVGLLANGARLVSENLVFHDDRRVYACYEPIRLTDASVELVRPRDTLVPAGIPAGAKAKQLFHVARSRRVDSVEAVAVFMPLFTATRSVRALSADDCLERLLAANQLTQEVNDYYWFASALAMAWPLPDVWRRRTRSLRGLLERAGCYELGIDRRRGIGPVVDAVLEHAHPRSGRDVRSAR